MCIGMILDNEFTGDMRVENEVASLVNAGFKVKVLCLTHGDKPTRENFHGATIIRKPMSKFLKNKTKPFIGTPVDIYSRLWKKWIAAFVEEEKIDVIHAHDLYMLPAVIFYRKQTGSSIPIVADLHENYPAALENYKWSSTFPGNLVVSIPKWRRNEIKWLGQVDHVVTVIEEATERYLRLGLPKSKVTVVANYVNEDFFQLPNEEDIAEIRKDFNGEFVISYVGGFDIHRGLEVVIKAMPMLLSEVPNIKLVLVGDGVNRSSLEEMSESLGVAKNVTFEGWQSPLRIPAYLGASDVCLIPHVKTEHTDHTIPHKLFQYMLLQKTVVASDCNPLERILKVTKAGLVYPHDNSAALAKILQKVLKSSEIRHQMGEAGRKAVLETYNWGKAEKELIDIYIRLNEN